MGLFSRPDRDLEGITNRLDAQERRVRDVLEELRGLERDIQESLRSMGERLDIQARDVRLMAEEVEERIDRGNKVWRKIRASQYYESQREDGEEDEQTDIDFHEGNGEGGAPEGMHPLYPHLGSRGVAYQTARELGKALARRKMGLE